MAMNRKGIVLSLVAIGLSGMFVIYFSSYYTLPVDNRMSSVQTRVLTLNSVIDDLFEFAHDSLKVSTYSSLESMYDHIAAPVNDTTPPKYLVDFHEDFVSCALNGTFMNGTYCGNDRNYTRLLSDYALSVKSVLNIDIHPEIEFFELIDERHWSFTFRSNISYTLVDEYASWSGWRNVTSSVVIDGIMDPAMLMIHHNYTNFSSVVHFSGIRIRPNYVQSHQWNPFLFFLFVQRNEYRESDDGICLSDRFEGNFTETSTTCGIMSAVNPFMFVKLILPSSPDNPTNNFTHIDYRLLRGETYKCYADDTSNPRVSVLNISYPAYGQQYENYHFILPFADAIVFNLTDNIYYNSSGSVTARGCPGCVMGGCISYS